MKKLIKILTFLSVFSFYSSFAANIDHFDVKLWKDSATANEALDLTVEAIDKNWNTVKNYVWTILILSETDANAELPKEIKDSTYIFKESDAWKVKFENAVKFKAPWKQTLNVYDLNDDTISWIADITIDWESPTPNADISIVSPEDWFSIGKNEVTVSWKTQKNHQVSIKLNWKENIKTTSNSEWIFEEKVTDLQNWKNILEATVLDADWTELWKSKSIEIEVDAKNPELKSVKITPNKNVEAESEVSIEVLAEKWLSEVQVVIDDAITKLTEEGEWLYVWKTNAPKTEWEYKVDVNLKNDIWNETKKIAATSISVVPKLAVAPVAPPVVVEIEGKPKKIYIITNIKLTKLKTQSILNWDAIPEAESYNIYRQLEWNKLELVDTVKEPRFTVNIVGEKITYDYFVVEPVIRTASWDIVKWILSDATKIQTWPKEILLLLILSFIIWFLILNRRKIFG